jgi:hypothetical protein
MSLQQIPAWAVVLLMSGATLAFGQAAASGSPARPAPVARPAAAHSQAGAGDGGVIVNI